VTQVTSTIPGTLRKWRDEQLAPVLAQGPGLLIDGAWRTPVSGSVDVTVDPSTGDPLGGVATAGESDVDMAVRAAAAAAPAWAALTPRARSDYIAALSSLVVASAEQLAAIDAIDGGLPLPSAREDVELALEQLRDWPGLALALRGETVPLGDGLLHYTTFKPFGVVARIVAFNHPFYFAATTILPALLAGNTVVLKPAEQAPLSALAFGELVRRALPPGVVNVVTGDRAAGEALVTHPQVSRIAFTGSTATGLQIQRAAAQGRVRTVTLELGGKNPMIVFPDVDVDAAVDGAVRGMSFRGTQGQSCGSTSRVFVHREIHDEFVAKLAERLQELRVDLAYADGVDVGPLVSARQADRVRGYVRDGVQEGARLVTGDSSAPERLSKGFFVLPTLFSEVTMEMRIAREEIFGPVVCVLNWDDQERLLADVNGLAYGLTASVWTAHIGNALPVVDALEAGYVWVNDTGTHYWGTPFGGFGDSGVGREECLGELESYMQVKAVHVAPGPPRL
jgi:betaine-aldehyde dehydrogenase